MKKAFATTLLISCLTSFCQIKPGIIRELGSGKPISFALVYKSDKSDGVYTDRRGVFNLKAFPGDTLIVKHVAYNETQIIVSPGADSLNTTMTESAVELQEVIVSVKRKEGKIKMEHSVIECEGYSKSYALLIPKDTTRMLKGVDIYISKDGIPDAPFRVLLTTDLSGSNSILDSYVFEVREAIGKSWNEVSFKEPLKVREDLFVVFERIYTTDHSFKSFGDNCNGVALGFSKVFDPQQTIFTNTNQSTWMDLELAKNGFNLMIKPIW